MLVPYNHDNVSLNSMSLLQRNAHMSLAITMSLTARMAGHVVHEISCTYGWTDYLSETVTSEGDIVMFSILYSLEIMPPPFAG